MAITAEYESPQPDFPYMMFFCGENGSPYADMVCVEYVTDPNLGFDWNWMLWIDRRRADEFDDISHCLEGSGEDYATDGSSVTFQSLDELLDTLSQWGYDEFEEMKSKLIAFFGQLDS